MLMNIPGCADSDNGDDDTPGQPEPACVLGPLRTPPHVSNVVVEKPCRQQTQHEQDHRPGEDEADIWSAAGATRYRAATREPGIVSYSRRVVGVVTAGRLYSYERLYWAVWVILTGLWVADRFTAHVWPRSWFGGASFGMDAATFEGETSVRCFDFVARASGRLLISALNALLLTMTPVLANIARERVVWLDMDDWRCANERIHRIVGVIVIVATILHSWAIFLPVALSGYRVQYEPPSQTIVFLPLSEAKVCPNVDTASKVICLMLDQVIRLGAVTVMLLVFLPLSMLPALRRRDYPMTMLLHVVVAVAFVFDMFRRRTQPHVWVLNSPFVLAFIVDRFAGFAFYRVVAKAPISTVPIDENYSLVTWQRSESTAQSMIADTYWVRASGARWFERSHPYSTMDGRAVRVRPPNFESRSPGWAGHKFQAVAGLPDNSEFGATITSTPTFAHKSAPAHTVKALVRNATSKSWLAAYTSSRKPPESRSDEDGTRSSGDIMAIVRMNSSARLCTGAVHTSLLTAATGIVHASIRGPYRSVYSRLSSAPHVPPLLLIGSGSGATFLMDFVGFVLQCRVILVNPVVVHYSADSVALFQFVTDHLCSHPVENLQVQACLTQADVFDYHPSHAEREMQLGRMDLDDIMSTAPASAEVYFCGSRALQQHVRKKCAQRGFVLHTEAAYS